MEGRSNYEAIMNIVIVGYDKMLAALISGAKFKGHNIVGVFRIDRVRYSKPALFFKDIFNASNDLSFIKSHKLYDIKADSVKSKAFLDEIKRLNPDIILVGSWSEKFPLDVINFPKYGVVNCHPSLLPKHRGANPYFWAIYSGDEKTGVTFHLMDGNFDTGKILMQAAFKIDESITGGELRNKAAKIAELMTGELLDDIKNNKIIPVIQDEDEATYDKYPYPDIDVVDFLESAKKVYDKVRALKPWGYCSCVLNGRVYRIESARILVYDDNPSFCGSALQDMPKVADYHSYKPGDVIEFYSDKKMAVVKCVAGVVEIKVL